MESFDAPRGTRDFLPDQMAVRNHVERVVKETFASYGFQQVQTPTFEQYELLAARSGEEIKESMFTFASDAGRYALRPELTSPVCRIIASGKLDPCAKPYKLFYYGPCFRYCRPQEGRYREFFQAGIELLGASDSLADAETIAVAHRVLRNLGITDFRLKVGNVGIFRQILNERAPENQLQREEWQAHLLHDLDRLMGITAKCRLMSRHGSLTLDEKEYLDREANILAALQQEVQYAGDRKLTRGEERTDSDYQQLLKDLPAIAQDTIRTAWLLHELLPEDAANLVLQIAQTRGEYSQVKEAATKLLAGTAGEKPLRDLWAVCNWLEELGVSQFEVVLGTVRNLDFYTGAVFEIDSPHLGAHRQLCGGGRYDTLVEDFGGPPTPATGFAFSFDRLVQIFNSSEQVKTVDKAVVDVFVLAEEQDGRPIAARLTGQLRDANLRATLDLMGRPVDQQLKHAKEDLRAEFAIVVSEESRKANQCKLIQFSTEHEQTVPLASAVEEINRIRGNN